MAQIRGGSTLAGKRKGNGEQGNKHVKTKFEKKNKNGREETRSWIKHREQAPQSVASVASLCTICHAPVARRKQTQDRPGCSGGSCRRAPLESFRTAERARPNPAAAYFL